jgi:DNA-binding NarL/FixJ family response regulator
MHQLTNRIYDTFARVNAVEKHMKHLLLIDNDTRFLLLMGDYLEEQGYRLSRAVNGKQGIEVFSRLARESRPPDLVVCDIMMPNMDGYEFVRMLRSMPGREVLPVIFLSAKGEVHDRIRGLKEGGDAYLVKPCEPVELVALAESLLRRSEHVPLPASSNPPEPWRNSSEPAIDIQFQVDLTKTEVKVLRHLTRGLPNKEIAKEMSVSPRTIESHVSNILQKTALTNRTELTRWAIESRSV